MARLLGLLLALFFTLPAQAADVSLKASDGTRLHALYESADGADKGVVLVHMVGRNAKDWRFLAERLNRAGFQTLAVDLRGHGKNVPDGADKPELTDADYQAMVKDVAAAVAYLRSKGVDQVSLIGASVGANLALQVAGDDADIHNVVLLSPGVEYKGVTSVDALRRYGQRPVLIAVSEEDAYAAKSALLLETEALGQHHLELLTAAGHGSRMLNKAPGLETLIQSWLLGTFEMVGTSTERRQVDIGGDQDSVETTGERLPTHQ